jgi:hypothetical protein
MIPTTVRDLTEVLKTASTDSNIKGAVLEVDHMRDVLGFAQAQEVRQAIEQFKNEKKRIAVFSGKQGRCIGDIMKKILEIVLEIP